MFRKFNCMGILYTFLIYVSSKIGGGSRVKNTDSGRKIAGSALLILFTIDFLHSLYVEKKEDIPECVWEMKDTLVEKILRS